MALFHSSVIVTGAATGARVRDQLSFAFNARPQAMTIYVRFRELGNLLNPNLAAPMRVFHIGSSAGTDPRILIDSGTGLYRALYDNGPLLASSIMAAAPNYGDLVELRLTLGATGIIQLNQSINGASETSATASGAAALPSAWSAATIWINSMGTANVGFLALRNIRIERGAVSLQRMRELEGITG